MCEINEQSKRLKFSSVSYPLISPIQEQLFSKMTSIDKLCLFQGNLLYEGRMVLWNLAVYSDNFKEKWMNWSTREKIQEAQKFLKCEQKYGKKLKNKKNPLKFISKLNISEKSKYWLSLLDKFSLKTMLFICNFDSVETEILGFFLICESIRNLALIESYDIYFTKLLDHAIYLRTEACSWLQNEYGEYAKIRENIEIQIGLCNNLQEYKKHLMADVTNAQLLLKKNLKKVSKAKI